MDITAADLRALLPAGITLSPTTYPDASSALAPVSELLDALVNAQAAQNANAPAGQDVVSATAANGAPLTIEYPAGSGTMVNVIPRAYTVTVYRRQSITDVFPVLA